MSFNPFARMQIKSFGENIRESSQMGKIEHFFFFGLFVAKLIHRFYIVIVPLFFSLRRMMRSDRFFFFFFSFLSGIKAKGLIEIRKEYNTSKGIRENYHYISF